MVPAGVLLALVAARTQTGGVVIAGVSAGGVGGGVVDVPDRGVTPRVAARVIPQDHHAAEQAVEQAPLGVHGDQLPGLRVRVQPAEPHPGFTGWSVPARVQQRPGRRGGDRTVAHHPRRGLDTNAVSAEHGGVRHHEMDLHRHCGCGGSSSEAFHQGVGHDLSPGPLAGLPGADHRPCVLVQRGERSDPLHHG